MNPNNNERSKFIIETERIYCSFESEIETLRQCPPLKKTDIVFRNIVASAYLKAYDFVRYICRLSNFQDAFFQLPMLRGICEDLIAISYLIDQKKEQQNFLLVVKRFEDLKRSTKAQSDFFTKYNKGQIVPPTLNEGDVKLVLEEYKRAGNILEETSLPNVYTMADKTGLKDLYSFIYHSTSKMVHFDILTLLSMGWGTINEEQGTMEANFSYRHDYWHYYTFALFYSSYLFIQQTKKFDSFLTLPEIIKFNLMKLEDGYKEIDWPELVTFNQMNIKPPNFLEKAVFRVMQDRSIANN